MPIPPIPRMTELDEEFITWAAGTYALRPEMCRGMLAAWYTMRAKRYALAIEHIQNVVKAGEHSLAELPTWESMYPNEVKADRAMWSALLPQLREFDR